MIEFMIPRKYRTVISADRLLLAYQLTVEKLGRRA